MENILGFQSHTGVGRIAPKIYGTEGPILILIHSIKDQSSRYIPFAKAMEAYGMRTILFDLPGHGSCVDEEDDYGYFGEKEEIGLIEDLNDLVEKTKSHFQEEDVFLIGQGFGASLGRVYLYLFPEAVRGAVFSGTESPNFFTRGILRINEEVIRENGDRYRSEQMDRILYDHYNKKIEDPKTDYDWISREEKIVEDYIQDEKNTILPTGNEIKVHYTLMREANSINWFQEVEDIPMFFIAGSADPVGDYGKGILEMLNRLKEEGKLLSDGVIYRDGRHDLLNEINKEEIFADIYQWIEETVLQTQKKNLG
ncbi:MAG: alpha/beta hydrolase [Gallicola sp.]|nr:alpha/beta hydrolase [Gallicola sp.]